MAPGRTRSSSRAWPLALAAIVAALAFALAPGATGGATAPPVAKPAPSPASGGHGLYSDFASRTVDARNIHFSPQYPLWSDGAGKNRWIYLPPGTAIDASDPGAGCFGRHEVLEEFAWSRRVERAISSSRAAAGLRGVRLTEDGADAVLAPEAA
jgi:hypothetical protein